MSPEVSHLKAGTIWRLAWRNLLGAGLKTWLSAGALSFAFVVIVFYNGLLDGWNRQAIRDTEAWEIGGGQLWHPHYDRYDPFSLDQAHGPLDDKVGGLIAEGHLAPILIVPATAYVQGRMINIQLRGIAPDQRILALPTKFLSDTSRSIPALIGKRMAKTARLSLWETVLVRWRDSQGAYDARELTVAGIFQADVPTIDDGQIWLSLPKLWEMTGLHNQATILVSAVPFPQGDLSPWVARDREYLLSDLSQIMRSKKAGSSIISLLLLAIALVAIFDTQVLSIFRRRREIGTLMALGMLRSQVVALFTLEGGLQSLLALGLAAVYGLPFLFLVSSVGIPMPGSADDVGVAISQRIVPYYGAGMLLISWLLVAVSTVAVSYWPSRKIAKMKPTEALRGR